MQGKNSSLKKPGLSGVLHRTLIFGYAREKGRLRPLGLQPIFSNNILEFLAFFSSHLHPVGIPLWEHGSGQFIGKWGQKFSALSIFALFCTWFSAPCEAPTGFTERVIKILRAISSNFKSNSNYAKEMPNYDIWHLILVSMQFQVLTPDIDQKI